MIKINRDILEKAIIRQKKINGREVSFSTNRDATIMNTAYFINNTFDNVRKTK